MFATVIFHAYAPITVPIVTATTLPQPAGVRVFEIPSGFSAEKKRTPRVTRILFTTRHDSCTVHLFLGKGEGKKEEEEEGGRRIAQKRAKEARNAGEERSVNDRMLLHKNFIASN